MKNIMIIDGSQPYAFDVHSVDKNAFDRIFPSPDRDIEFAEDFRKRSDIENLQDTFKRMWYGRIDSHRFNGIHGIIFYENQQRRPFYQNQNKLYLSANADIPVLKKTVTPLQPKAIFLFDRKPSSPLIACSASTEAFETLFPVEGQDVAFLGPLISSIGATHAHSIIDDLRLNNLDFEAISGIDGTLYIGCDERISHFPNRKDSDAERYYPLRSFE